jgi:SsrA-binding protein
MSETKKKDQTRRLIAENRRARFDYEIEESIETGIVLVGSEVKALRQGKANMADTYAAVEDGELWIYNLHIQEYAQANQFNHEITRKRKLLASKHEIAKLQNKLRDGGMTLVAQELYFIGPWVKVKLGLARGRKSHDKRQHIAERDAKRDIARVMRRGG